MAVGRTVRFASMRGTALVQSGAVYFSMAVISTPAGCAVPERARSKIRFQLGFPGVLSVGTDDIAGLFRRRPTSNGPYILVGRDRAGLSLDTAYAQDEGHHPILWPAHAQPQQLWAFQQTRHSGELLIVSIANKLVLDAGSGRELRRHPWMSARTEKANQRWRLHPTQDGAAYVVESVLTGHVLDIPDEAGPETHTSPVLWHRHDGMNQQFLIVSPTGGPQ
ncbi:RICIN domain-containing protein [Streptomyces antibioticus]|uniref:RICIN domain-containing protein n=1 Tax=Streptomyces antibioticus TaxID=1890 RepID=UPI0036B3BB10